MDNNKKTQLNVIDELNKVLSTMGWAIAIPDRDNVDHLIVGKTEKVIRVVRNLPEKYDIMEKEPAQ